MEQGVYTASKHCRMFFTIVFEWRGVYCDRFVGASVVWSVLFYSIPGAKYRAAKGLYGSLGPQPQRKRTS